MQKKIFSKSLTLGILLLMLPISRSAIAAIDEYGQVVNQLGQAVESYKKLGASPSQYNAVSHRDPLRPMVDHEGNIISSLGTRGGLTLQGIIWSPTYASALIDDQFYSVGDSIGSYKITAIKPDRLILRTGDGKETNMPLYSELGTRSDSIEIKSPQKK